MLTDVLGRELESDAPPVASRTSPKPPLAFACAGCSAAGRMAYDLALELDRLGEVEMSCLAGIGARHPRFLSLLPGRRVLVIDGCRTDCARGLFNQAGLGHHVQWHVCLPDFGIGAQPGTGGAMDIGTLAERVLWSLYGGWGCG
jgi:uncharacterized metal-binding protein